MQACERLLEMRVAAKLRGNKVDDFLNRLHVAVPAKRDTKVWIPSFEYLSLFLVLKKIYLVQVAY